MKVALYFLLLVVITAAVDDAITQTAALECRDDPSGDGSIMCQFRLNKAQQHHMHQNTNTNTNTHQEEHSVNFEPTCVESNIKDKDQQTTKTTCLGAGSLTVTVTTTTTTTTPNGDPMEPKQPEPEQELPPPPPADSRTDEDDDDAAGSDSPRDHYHERILEVGKATYRPPFLQHGSRVEAVLRRVPRESPPTLDDWEAYWKTDLYQEWLHWYVELADAHYPTTDQEVLEDDDDDAVWVEVELAMNAYRQVIQQIGNNHNWKHSSMNQIYLERDAFLAMVYYHLGECYSLDPEFKYIHQAVDSYQQAHKLYQQVLEHGSPETLPNWQQLEARFAEASTKLGMALLSSMDPMETAMLSMGTASPSTQATLRQIQEHFQTAVRLYQKYVIKTSPPAESANSDPEEILLTHYWDRHDLEIGYATAIQQAASVAAMQGNLVDAKQYYEQALGIHRDVLLPKLASSSHPIYESKHSHTAMADLYLSISDTCVQLGNYTCAKESYQNAMNVHAKYNIPVAPLETMMMEGDIGSGMGGDFGEEESYDTSLTMVISETLEALKEYRASTTGGGGGRYRRPYSDGLDGPGDAYGQEYYYEKDDGYEGDLLASLGTMYLSLGENEERAIGYLEKAAAKYSNSPEDRDSPAMADLLINIAMAYYRNYQFEASKEAQWKALDIFQSIYGEGVNPYTQDENYNEMLNMMKQQQQQHQHDSMGGSSGYRGGTQFSSQPEQQMKQEGGESTTSFSGESTKPKEEGKKIDVETYRRSIENITETANDPKAAAKEEL